MHLREIICIILSLDGTMSKIVTLCGGTGKLNEKICKQTCRVFWGCCCITVDLEKPASQNCICITQQMCHNDLVSRLCSITKDENKVIKNLMILS